MSNDAEVFAKYHDDHGEYGGVSKEFHVRAASCLRNQAKRIAALEAKLARVRELANNYRTMTALSPEESRHNFNFAATIDRALADDECPRGVRE